MKVNTLAVASANNVASFADFIVAVGIRIRDAVGTVEIGPLHIQGVERVPIYN